MCIRDRIVCSDSHTKGKLLAGKLVVSYPLTDQLNIDFGSEYTNSDSHTCLLYTSELQNILTPIAGHFHLQVTYQNESARHICLFLQLEKNMSLDDIIELMNHFEKVNIRHEGQTLIVE